MSAHDLLPFDPKNFPGRDVYAVIGHPVAHSLSPQIHTYFAKQTKQNMVYGKLECDLGAFNETVNAFFKAGGKGLNVTVPFKLDAFAMATVTSDRAKQAQAANVLWQQDGKFYADNTDGMGLILDLRRQLGLLGGSKSLEDAKVLIVGAGGAAQGCIGPLLSAQARLYLTNRSHEKALVLQSQFKDLAAVPIETLENFTEPGFDLVINATAAGLQQSSPLSRSTLRSITHAHSLVYDMVYGQETAMMTDARSLGLSVSDGLGMLVEQAAESFRLWRHVDLQTQVIEGALAQLRA